MFASIENISKKNKDTVSDTIRKLLTNSLNTEWCNDNGTVLMGLIREQVDVAMKTHVERICKLSAKTGHAALATMYLNAEALEKLVAPDKVQSSKEALEKAKKKAVVDMKKNPEDFEKELLGIKTQELQEPQETKNETIKSAQKIYAKNQVAKDFMKANDTWEDYKTYMTNIRAEALKNMNEAASEEERLKWKEIYENLN